MTPNALCERSISFCSIISLLLWILIAYFFPYAFVNPNSNLFTLISYSYNWFFLNNKFVFSVHRSFRWSIDNSLMTSVGLNRKVSSNWMCMPIRMYIHIFSSSYVTIAWDGEFSNLFASRMFRTWQTRKIVCVVSQNVKPLELASAFGNTMRNALGAVCAFFRPVIRTWSSFCYTHFLNMDLFCIAHMYIFICSRFHVGILCFFVYPICHPTKHHIVPVTQFERIRWANFCLCFQTRWRNRVVRPSQLSWWPTCYRLPVPTTLSPWICMPRKFR